MMHRRYPGILLIAGALLLCAATAQAAMGEAASLWDCLIHWMLSEQRALHKLLTQELRSLSGDGGIAAAWALISASFLYGVFHAAGPGHGKAILATYLLTHRAALGRSTALATTAAFCQGVVAVVLVYGLIYLAGWLPRDTSTAVGWSERASFAILLGMGAMLCWRAGRGLLAAWRGQPHHAHHHHHGLPARGHSHAHDHDDACCGHSHLPTAEQAAGTQDLRAAVGVVLSIGLRPCTGAVLVLVFAKVLGLAWAGVAAVAAMSAGTALAVAILAVLAVKLRDLAARLAESRGGGWPFAGHLVALAGGAVLFLFGWSLLAASFAPGHPLGL